MLNNTVYEKRIKDAGRGIIVLEGYVNTRHKHLVKCSKCDYEWRALPSSLFKGHGCAQCAGLAPWTEDTYKKALKEAHGNKLTLLDFSCTSHRCNVCDDIWEGKALYYTLAHGCASCAYSNRSGFKLKDFQLGKRVVRIQGYEDRALRYVLSKGAKPKSIAVTSDEGKPLVRYVYKRKSCLYIPDFYFKPRKRIVEVKSLWTFGATEYSPEFFKKNVAKAKACVEQGFEFTMLIFSSKRKDKPFKLPKDWYLLSRSEVMKGLKVQTC